MIALADDYEEVTEVSKGSIAATTGLKVKRYSFCADFYFCKMRKIISFLARREWRFHYDFRL